MDDEKKEGKLRWHSAIISHERRIQLMAIRVEEKTGKVLDDPRGLNEKFDEDEWEEAVRSFVEWIEEQCTYLDYYWDVLRDVENGNEDLQTATADRDDWEGTTPSDAGEAAFGLGPEN